MSLYIKNVSKIKKIAILSVLISQALVFSVLEAWIPMPSNVPGVKLGLANIITIIVLLFFSISDALLLVLIKCLLLSLFTGGPVMFIFSISGGIVSTFIMWFFLLCFNKWFSLVGISIMGALAHNFVQILVSCFILNDLSVLAYFPILTVSGIFAGSFVGCCSTLLVKALKKQNILTRSTFLSRI